MNRAARPSVEDSGKFPQDLWKTLADSGWFGIGTKSEGTGIIEWMLVLEQMGRAGRERVPPRYAVGRLVDDVDALYRSLLSEGGAGRR